MKFRNIYFALLLALFSCNNSTNNIKVGGLFALSGGAVAYGEDVKKGTELAIEEINSTSPIKLELIIKDTKSEKNEAVKAFEDLVTLNKVSAILGPTTSPNAIVLGGLADQYRIPMIVQVATQDEVVKSNNYQRKFVTRICFNDAFQGRVLADYAYFDLKGKKAIIVYDNSVSYSVGLSDSFEKQFIKNGGEIVFKASYSVEQKDFRALIEKIALLDADFLFLPGWDENIGPMLRQAQNKWDKFVILGGDGITTDKFIELSGGNLKNVYTLGHYNPNSENPKVKKFIDSYKNKYGVVPSPHAALGYDAVYVLYDAIKKSGKEKVSSDDIIENLKKIKELELVSGNISFDDSGDVIKSGVILKVTKDGYEYVKTVN